MEQMAEELTYALLAARFKGEFRLPLAQKLRPSRHKYDMGHLLLIAGSAGMTGAMVLAARAAARSGCGLVTVAHPTGTDIQLNIAAPSVMTRAMDWHNPLESIGDPSRYTALAIGPGLGRAPRVAAGVRTIITHRNLPVIALDADALWTVSPAGNAGEPFDFRAIKAPLILTPHLGEFKRLFAPALACSSPADEVARGFTQSAHRYLILKQATTRIYTPRGCIELNKPNGGMAAGGSGDVLLGLLGGLLAWMPSVELACMTAVLAHSIAGETAREAMGELAMNPTDTVDSLGKAMLQLEQLMRPAQR